MGVFFCAGEMKKKIFLGGGGDAGKMSDTFCGD